MNTMRPRTGRVRSAALLGAVALAVTGLVGCGASQDGAADAAGNGPRDSVSLAAQQRAITPGADPTAPPSDGTHTPRAEHRSQTKKPKLPPGVSTKKPKDPLAPKHIAQVERHGKAPHPTIKVKGKAKPFTKPITYTDGLTLRITKMTQGKMKGHGPGVFPGRPVTNFYVTLTNNTHHKFKIGVVVVTVQYGEPSRLAHPVYGPKSKDFFGTIKPGKSVKAVYGFSVPKGDRDDVTMTVDIDGHHELATFTGAVK